MAVQHYDVATTGGPMRDFGYDANGNTTYLQTQDGATTVVLTLHWDANDRPVRIDYTDGSRTEMAYDCDHLGAVREVVEVGSATVLARFDYDPWGRRTQTEGTMAVDFAFTGHFFHEMSGLHMAPYREYSAELEDG